MTRRLYLGIALLLGLALLDVAAIAQRPAFRSGTDLVAVIVTVTDSLGRSVPDLDAASFAVYENDRPRPISQFSGDPQPLSLVVAVDTSFSMRGARFDNARAAVDRLAGHLRSADEVYIVGFSEVPFAIADWTTNRELVNRALAQIQPDGNTGLYDAISQSVTVLSKSKNRKQAVVVISDGNDRLTWDNRFDGSSFSAPLRRFLSARARVQESEALVYTIGIDAPNVGGHDPLDLAPLQLISESSGAFNQVSHSADDLEAAADRIVSELRHQYLIGFQPENLDGKFHRIKIVVKNCTGCDVRARPGFIARPRR